MMAYWKWTMLILGSVASAFFIAEEIQYLLLGATKTAKVLFVEEEFAGFSQRINGSKPILRSKIDYEFEVENSRMQGTTTTYGKVQNKKTIKVQYLENALNHNRAITTYFWRIQIVKAILFIAFIFWVAILVKSRANKFAHHPNQCSR